MLGREAGCFDPRKQAFDCLFPLMPVPMDADHPGQSRKVTVSEAGPRAPPRDFGILHELIHTYLPSDVGANGASDWTRIVIAQRITDPGAACSRRARQMLIW